MKNSINVLFLLSTLLNIFSCESPSENSTLPDLRYFVWEKDTIIANGSEQTSMRSIWASNERNVWICGHTATSGDNLWHFNGTEWRSINFFDDIGPRSNTLWKVFGTERINIWVVGSSDDIDRNTNKWIFKSLIIEYNGIKWTEHKVVGSTIYGIWGDSRNNIWACGKDGLVFHYNGNIWTKDSISVDLGAGQFELQLLDIVGFEEHIYITGVKNDIAGDLSQTYEYFFKKTENGWAVIDSFHLYQENTRWGGREFKISDEQEMFSCGVGGIFKWNNNSWLNLYGPYTFRDMHIVNRNKIVGGGDGGWIFYYNGSTWEILDQFIDPNISIYHGVWMNENNAVFIGSISLESGTQTIIWRGKAKE